MQILESPSACTPYCKTNHKASPLQCCRQKTGVPCRATYSRLMANLGEAWRECSPGILGEANELDAVLAMQACLQSMRLLLQRDTFNKSPGQHLLL